MSRLSILANRLGLSGGIGGGGGENPKETPKQSLSYDQINKWSGFVEENPNLKGMDEMWTAFSNKYPGHGIDRTVLTQNLDNLVKMTQDNSNRFGNRGGVTTGLAFPKMTFNGQDYGRVNGMMQTQTPMPNPENQYPEKLVQKSIPDGVKDFWYDDKKGLWAYDDPWEGTVKYAAKPAGSSEYVKNLVAQQAKKP